MMPGIMTWWWVPMALLSVVFFVVILIILFWVLGKLYPSGRQSHSSSTALEVLKERLARGEITEEEYRRLKKILEE
ncbi:SHOCT domain-containing protein [Infirmifilum lucidum]|uniref:SHOCT domain-containing protein n=2 Tax=Infirmifilum lucidum TaxID=2776706 RepID=A0A7L9FJC8_9CREN|nr:SHOCT domain-containing protein [Infirmifilum lucidum]